jgi:hypothetical protein
MNLNNKPPVFVPHEHWAEIEKLSKAALMDMVWDFAVQITGSDDPMTVMHALRERREIILANRSLPTLEHD